MHQSDSPLAGITEIKPRKDKAVHLVKVKTVNEEYISPAEMS